MGWKADVTSGRFPGAPRSDLKPAVKPVGDPAPNSSFADVAIRPRQSAHFPPRQTTAYALRPVNRFTQSQPLSRQSVTPPCDAAMVGVRNRGRLLDILRIQAISSPPGTERVMLMSRRFPRDTAPALSAERIGGQRWLKGASHFPPALLDDAAYRDRRLLQVPPEGRCP
jgi:hypothetical protein